jgi:hypothetical protein
MKSVTRTTIILLILALFATASFAAGQARVRVVHASPDAPAVDVLVNDTIPAFTDVAFGEFTDYAPLPANIYNFKVVPSGGSTADAVIDADANLSYFASYTVVAVDVLDEIRPIVMQDNNLNPILGRAKVRFVHASPDAPAVDIRIVDGPFLFQNVAFTEVGDYATIPQGIYNLEVRLAGTDTVALEIPGVMIEPGSTYTAFAVGLAGGSPGLSVVLSQDSKRPRFFNLGDSGDGTRRLFNR